MQILLFSNFTKRMNSTKTPSDSAGTLINANLKDNTSIESPSFLVTGNNFNYTYCKAFNQYYYVEDIISVNANMSQLVCVKDEMASFKASIKASTQYVTRSNIAVVDGINDDLYARTVTPATLEQTLDLSIGKGSDIIFSVKGSTNTYYACGKQVFAQMIKAMSDVDQGDLWDRVKGGLNQDSPSFLTPFDFLGSVQIIALTHSDISGTSTSTVSFGLWEYTDPDGAQVFKKLDFDNIFTASGSVSIRNPYADIPAKRFLGGNNYRAMTLKLQGASPVVLDADALISASTLTISAQVDASGSIVYELTATGTHYHEFITGSISAPFGANNTMKSASNKNRIVGDIFATVGGIAGGYAKGGAGGAIVGGAIGLLGTETAYIGSAQPLVNIASNGSEGSIAGILKQRYAILSSVVYDIVDQDANTYGYPVCMRLQLNANGFYQIANPVISFTNKPSEAEAIANYMRNGFYIE